MTLAEVRYTLLGDGPTDAILMHHINWILTQHTNVAIQPRWADLSRLPIHPKRLEHRIQHALELYPCDLLCVHRDAEREGLGTRKQEIYSAISTLPAIPVPVVCVVPVRMQESWLLFDEIAIRRAAGNPRGHIRLGLPRLTDTEVIVDPKEMLYELLRTASGLGGRRLRGFRHAEAARRVGECISDFSPLRRLPAFASFEADIVAALANLGV